MSRPPNSISPIRVLQVVYSMNRGGVETWLMHLFRNIDRKRFRMDFMTHTDKPGDYDEEIRALGGRIFPCLQISQPWHYARNFKKIIREHGPYDCVHAHDAIWSGHVLRLAERQGISKRIVHSHISAEQPLIKGILRRMYVAATRPWINHYATLGLACSESAAEWLFGRDWRKDHRWNTLYYGQDFSAFRKVVDRHALKKEFGFPENAIVVGHVGSFRNGQKNHSFLVKIAAHLVHMEPKIHFLLVGDGCLREKIYQEVVQLGISKNVVFTGVRSDIPRLMLGAMDLFLFPSFFEGLGIVLVEAQAAGLPCLCSEVIPEEADVVPALIRRMSLFKSPYEWAQAALEMTSLEHPVSQHEALQIMEASRFNLLDCVGQMQDIYST